MNGSPAPLAPRPYLIEDYTRTVCPACFTERPRRADEPDVLKDGMLVTRDGAVYLRRACAEHGESESLYEEDAEIWRARRGWSTPTLAMTPDRPGPRRPFPAGYRDGLPATHGQHTCILLLNLTQRCDARCATCYAAAEPTAVERPPTRAEILATVRAVLAREHGRLGVLMLSGGEPTLRADLPEIVAELVELPITRILLNTNGLRLATDDALVELLRAHRRRLEVYLHFDTLRPETSRVLHGADLTGQKLRALARLDEARVFTTLVSNLHRRINEDEVGDLVRLSLDTPRCTGVALQPQFAAGRHLPPDPLDRVTPTGVLRRLAAQTRGLLDWTDFIPLPCSHRDCCDLTYLIRTKGGEWRSLPKLLGREELARWIHVVGNTVTFDNVTPAIAEMLREGVLQRVFSNEPRIGALSLMRDIGRMCQCIPGLPELITGLTALVPAAGPEAMDRLAERTRRITLKMFMDAHRFHDARFRQCCVHVGTFEADPRRHPFCYRWLFADATDRPMVEVAPAAGGAG